MNGRNAKIARKAANDAAVQTGKTAGEALMLVAEYAHAIEEKKVKPLEAAVSALEIKARAWDAFRLRTFSRRLSWLLTGR